MSSAQPPQPPAGGSGDDPFSWLYQRGQPAPTEDEAPPVPHTIEAPSPRPMPIDEPARPVDPAPTLPPVSPRATEPPGPPPTYVRSAYQPGTALPPSTPPPLPPEPPKRRGVLVGVLVGVAVIAVAAGIGVAFWLTRPQPGAGITPTPSVPASSRAAGPVVPTGVSASCTAPAATDDAGRTVTYDAANVLDADPNTAWRCDGDGKGDTLTFTFPAGTTIDQVGLVNGYAKTDPTSGAKRYGEYRRITEVRWTLDGNRSVTQKLGSDNSKLQTLSVDGVATTRVVLTIEDSTKPGSNAKTRDAVLISSVSFR